MSSAGKLAGTSTFLFTDIESSTQLWEKYPETMRAALAAHDDALKAVVADHRGEVVKTTGDGMLAIFASATDAVTAAVAAQRALRAQEPPGEGTPRIRVRMGLHSGEAQARDGDYYGGTLNRLARLMAIGHGGQVLLSSATSALVRERLPDAATLQDMGEHRLKDLTQPERVYQLDAPDLPREFPPLKSLGAYRHNLPVQLTSFIGRETELADVTRLLAGTRLLTLIGPGGTGKTRLSLQAAADSLDHFPDGAWFAELAPITDPAQVEQAIAGAFGLREESGTTLARSLDDYVRYKQLLLVLDNCEHLIGAAAQTAQRLLQAGPQIKILSSSREGLAIAGETIYQVPSLGLPPEGVVEPDVMAPTAAVRLFVERAQAVVPAFALTVENAPAVAEICRRVDGIPLAIELAAVRVRMMPPAQIAARLRDHFRLLTGGSRTAMPRQQTLQALIDWSWNLLGEDERTLLRRLSVFAGGWSLEAAEHVVPMEGDSLDILEGLGQLVNRSLVIAQEHGDTARYSLLETMRQYARDKLLAAGESAAVHERHARYYAQLANEYELHAYSAEMRIWLEKFEADAGNFGAAHDWLSESDPLSALKLANAICTAFQRNARMAESARRLSDSMRLVRAQSTPDSPERRVALAIGVANLTNVHLAMGNTRAGRESAREAVQLARAVGDAGLLAFALGHLAEFDTIAGDLDAGEAEAREAIEKGRFEPADSYWIRRGATAIALSMQAYISALRGEDSATTVAIAARAMRAPMESANPWAFAMASLNAARAASMVGDFRSSRSWMEQGIAALEHAGERALGHAMGAELGHILRRQGLRDEARAAYRRSIGWFLELGNLGGVAHQLECFAMLAVEEGAYDHAARLFGAAQRLRDQANSPSWAHERAEYDAARERLSAALDPVALHRAWDEGVRLSPKEAIALAVQ